MKVVTLPGTDVRVSRLGLGTAGLFRLATDRERKEVVAAALDVGILHFDTAPLYGLGQSEQVLGRVLGGHRSRVTLATKFGLGPSRAARALAPLQRFARSAVRRLSPGPSAVRRLAPITQAVPAFHESAVRSSLERSLRALRTDYVDLFLAHEITPELLVQDDLVSCLLRMREAGLIRAFGTATGFARTLAVARSSPSLCAVAQFESDALQPNVPPFPGARLTHGALARALPLLRSVFERDPGRLARWSKAVGADLASEDCLGSLLMRAALLANPSGVVLMQSRSPRRVVRNAQVAGDPALDLPVRRLLRLVARESLHD